MPQTIISILGVPLSVETKYVEGHPCSAEEAKILHQAMVDALRNNFNPRVKKVKLEAEKEGREWPNQEDTLKIISAFEDYASSYTFGMKRPDKVAVDPYEDELEKVAKLAIKIKLKSEGIDPASIDEETWASYMEKAKQHEPVILEARKRAAVYQDTALSKLVLPPGLKA